MSKQSFVVSKPKFTRFFLLNAVERVVAKAVYRLPIFEVFEVKRKRCPKLRRILDVFCFPKL